MRRLAAAALALAIALPVCAQRGGGHASVAARGAPAFHSAPVSHGSFARPQTFHSTRGPFPMMRAPVRPPAPQRVFAPGVRYPVAAPAMRPTFYQNNYDNDRHGDDHHGNNTHRFPGRSFGYPVSVVGFLPTDLLDDSFDYDDSGYAQQPVPPDYADGYASPSPDYAQQQPQPDLSYTYPAPGYPPYPQPQPQPSIAATPQMQYAPGSADTVTLIFKDGRPPEQIKNYLATKKTLTIIDGHRHHDIPIADLDVPATVKANRETGVGFQLPNATP